MSKIDEIQELIQRRHDNTFSFAAISALEYCSNYIDQLRPYIELAEMVADYYNEPVYDEAQEQQIQLLIDQIKEQEK